MHQKQRFSQFSLLLIKHLIASFLLSIAILSENKEKRMWKLISAKRYVFLYLLKMTMLDA